MSRVLVVEDESHLADGLRFNLEAEGYAVDVVGEGESAIDLLTGADEIFDVVVLDVMLPGMNGFEVVAALRRARNYVPVLILTARGRPEDVLEGFGAGADDYLPKPFQLPIFLARLQGLLRRREWLRADVAGAQRQRRALRGNGRVADVDEAGPREAESVGAEGVDAESVGAESEEIEVCTIDGKTIDFGALELRTLKNTIQLTLMEAKLLRHLIQNAGRTVSRKQILEDVWDLREDTDTRAIDNFIVRLRRYLEDNPAKPRHLLTVRGVGYRFVG